MAVEETSCIVSSSSISLPGMAWDLGAGWEEFVRPVPGASDVHHQAASERKTEYNTVLENPPTATENEVDDILLAASQAYKAEEASKRQTEEPPTGRVGNDLLLGASHAYEAEEASERQNEEPPTARAKSARLLGASQAMLRNNNHRCLTESTWS